MVPQRLVIDFVAPPAPTGLGRVLLCVGVLALAAGAVQLGLAWQDYRQERAELASAAQRGVAPVGEMSGRARAAVAAELKSAGTVARGLTAPWQDLLQSIETIQNKDVALQIIEPIAARQSVRITADARHFDAMLDYLDQLRARALSDVVLTSHQVQVRQPGSPIRFQVQARWGDPASGARVRSAAPATQASNAEPDRGPR
jgi:Tfp pilus assembly protein PilN